jgi:superfamily II DNA/RNA helicase
MSVETMPDTGVESSSADTADVADTVAAAPVSGPVSALSTGTDVTFDSLGLPAPLVGVLTESGVTTAFPIQAATIPDALVGRDVLGRGQTGSGKTLAFGLPTLARLEGLRAKPRKPIALILVPTRELAMQVDDSLRPYARALHLRIRAVYGGAPMRKQIDGLRYGVEVLVATPGRLSDLIERGECELDEVDIAILDEADQMCDMGFLPHVCELMDQVAVGGQRLLFSATLDGAVDQIVSKYMSEPVLHEVDPQEGSVTTMSHHLLMVTPQHKAKVVAQIAARHVGAAEGTGVKAEARSIFFVRTQMAVDRVTEQLRERGLPAAGLHGGMTQVARTKTLEDFKDGRTPILIATDVAARGIHVDGIDLVVHIDPPRDSKDYLHRAGRTARAGQAGIVASLMLPKQRKQGLRMMDDAGVTAQELDVAPVGLAGKWEKGGSALVELTGAKDVPEPGDVPVFNLPVRERASRFGERRGGGSYGGGERRSGGSYGGGSSSGGSSSYGGGERRSGSSYGGGSYGGGGERRSGSSYGGSGSFGRDDRRGSGSFERRDRPTGDRYVRDDRRPAADRPAAGADRHPRTDDRRTGSFERRTTEHRPAEGRTERPAFGGARGRDRDNNSSGSGGFRRDPR